MPIKPKGVAPRRVVNSVFWNSTDRRYRDRKSFPGRRIVVITTFRVELSRVVHEEWLSVSDALGRS